jgi:succinyl-CoA synthetase beta subunit
LHGLIEKAKKEKRHLLEPEVLSLLDYYGIQIPPYKVIRSENEALEAAKSLGWPVAMKIVSPDVIHKTDVGGVILDIQNEKQANDAFSRLYSLESTDKKIEGIIIYPFQKVEVEISVGMVRDSQFGPVITFGLGGIWIEVFHDVAYAIAPLSIEEAENMMDSIQAHEILKDFRKRKPVDRKALSELLVCVSQMAMKEVAIQEMDLNPIFPLEKGYFIADGRII